MKKALIITSIVLIIGVGGFFYLRYRFSRIPEMRQIDWLNGWAIVVFEGNELKLYVGESKDFGNGYVASFVDPYRFIIIKNGVTVDEYVTNKPY